MTEIKAENWLLFFSAEQARRPAVIRQILTKRLSNSALFWGMRYQILDYINVYPQLDTQYYDYQIDLLCQQKKLKRNKAGLVSLTQLGTANKEKLKGRRQLACPQLFSMYRVSDLVWMIRLLIQVASEARWGNNRYYVAVDNFECQMVVKRWLKKYGMHALQDSLLHDLTEFLDSEDQLDAWIFCAQFIGHNTIPLTIQQLSTLTGLTLTEVEVVSLDLTSRFALHIVESGSTLTSIIQHFRSQNSLYEKSNAALALVKKGNKIIDIAQQKRLKESTIREHILNAAIFNVDFPFSLFLNAEEENRLLQLLPDDIDKWKYKMVESEQEELSFFKYRLFAIKRSRETLEY
ncbi:hypothetical protein GNF18_09155 [Ligilactobacillus pobuzihii]|uniref:helix-turn-helix domain-containing protein n=1 Tax=Ligilactobacillus pobuzihii TaxID=449659 RepID=UPI0019D1BEFF|nr:helix-turn-helix domain-containing protein [Ligilactobacillus pobuzihii]MBN7275305.1 hypothetical protein [Ligilactobacillus pobuzihii]